MVPSQPIASGDNPQTAVMELTYNGSSVRRQFPVTPSNLNLFADLSTDQNPCPNVPTNPGFQPIAMNQDGSMNSCTNPAKPGSTVSFFAHGGGGSGAPFAALTNLHASVGFACTALIDGARLVSDYVYQLDVSLPASLAPCGETFSGTQGVPVTLTYNEEPIGPFAVPADATGPSFAFPPPGRPMFMILWIQQ